jgi:hypothetical protein
VLARASLLGLICMLAVACSGGPAPSSSAKPSSSASTQPSASADGSGAIVDEAFCGTVADMESELAKLETIAIKAANRTKLKDQAAKVKMSLGAITDAASGDLADLVDTLSTAVDGLSSSAENYATSGTPDTASKRLKKSINTLHGAITDLREAALCGP